MTEAIGSELRCVLCGVEWYGSHTCKGMNKPANTREQVEAIHVHGYGPQGIVRYVRIPKAEYTAMQQVIEALRVLRAVPRRRSSFDEWQAVLDALAALDSLAHEPQP